MKTVQLKLIIELMQPIPHYGPTGLALRKDILFAEGNIKE